MSKAYHHGGLRRALVLAATELVVETGDPELSLRAVARRAGVSHAAAYHHFDDRRALLAAVAAEGLASLTAAMQRAWKRAAEPPASFFALGAAYVRFGLEKPALYRVMFGPGTAKRADHPELERAAAGTFATLVHAVEDCQRAGVVRGGSAVDLALTAWAAVHGIASLLLDGQLSFPGVRGRSPRVLAEAVLAGYFIGARAPSAAKARPKPRRPPSPSTSR
ncbi:MAG: TetR/AcrR family transcriptional regulator [Polyangiales bacterium]